MDPKKACEYYNDCYVDPSTFTVMIVGAIDIKNAMPLILQYLVNAMLVYIFAEENEISVHHYSILATEVYSYLTILFS